MPGAALEARKEMSVGRAGCGKPPGGVWGVGVDMFMDKVPSDWELRGCCRRAPSRRVWGDTGA